MTRADNDTLIRQLIAGDAEATARIATEAGRSAEPAVLVAAALTGPDAAALLARAAASAATTRDRQLVAIAAAYLDGDTERVDVLAREHLADYPDNILVAWIAGAAQASPAKERS